MRALLRFNGHQWILVAVIWQSDDPPVDKNPIKLYDADIIHDSKGGI